MNSAQNYTAGGMMMKTSERLWKLSALLNFKPFASVFSSESLEICFNIHCFFFEIEMKCT